MSVRTKPTREQVKQGLYARVGGSAGSGTRPSASMPVACAAPACGTICASATAGPALRLAAMLLPLMLVLAGPG